MLDQPALGGKMWREATKLAGLNQKRQMAALLEEFPELFQIKGPAVTLLV
jgi:hypothetical protein